MCFVLERHRRFLPIAKPAVPRVIRGAQDYLHAGFEKDRFCTCVMRIVKVGRFGNGSREVSH